MHIYEAGKHGYEIGKHEHGQSISIPSTASLTGISCSSSSSGMLLPGEIPLIRLLFLEPLEPVDDLSAFFFGECWATFSHCFSRAYLMVPGTALM